MKVKKERRAYQRYDTAIKIFFKVSYPIETKIKFQIINGEQYAVSRRRYSGLSKNISVEGICFTSHKLLHEGEVLALEIYLPGEGNSVNMTGQVRWSRLLAGRGTKTACVINGVKLLTVNGMPVHKTIHYDKPNRIIWSAVLDSVFGNYSKFVKKTKHNG